jgi:hypothetical protein
MNQHITKLVRQALNECVSTPVESVIASRIDDHGIVEIPNTFAEKFAELIVGECLELVDGYTKQRAYDTYYKAEEQIQAHFGVDE